MFFRIIQPLRFGKAEEQWQYAQKVGDIVKFWKAENEQSKAWESGCLTSVDVFRIYCHDRLVQLWYLKVSKGKIFIWKE